MAQKISKIRVWLGEMRQRWLPWRIYTLFYPKIVRAGPFAGMHYLKKAVGSALTPKLVGSYEDEIASLVLEANRQADGPFVDIGAAEGYYAVGIARTFPGKRVITYESDPTGQSLQRELAARNEVSTQLEIRGYASRQALEELAEISAVVLIDIESGEKDLLTTESAKRLASSVVFVETHSTSEGCTTEHITNVLKLTHDLNIIGPIHRPLEQYRVPGLRLLDLIFQEEHRGTHPNSWVHAIPKSD